MDRGIPRDGYKVFDEAGNEIGYVTSGSLAPFLKKNIALAYVPPQHSEIGHEVFVEISGQKVKCSVVPTPFYKRPKNRSCASESGIQISANPNTLPAKISINRKIAGPENQRWHIRNITSTRKSTSGYR